MRKKILAALLSLFALTALCAGTACAAGTTAAPTNDALTCDGVLQTPTVYKINDSNYFKIRDLAAILNGTGKQFAVGYDAEKQSVTADTGAGYIKLNTDLTGAPAGGNKSASPSNDAIYINGVLCKAEVYKIDGMNYFKLRDLGQALNFYVGWDSSTNTVALDTTKGYGEEPATNPVRDISDQALFELAEEIMVNANYLGLSIANAGFLECDSNDFFTVNNEGWTTTFSRVLGYQTIAQAQQGAREFWYSVYSRRNSGVSDHELSMFRFQLEERDGKLYRRDDGGVGDGGGYPVLTRMVSRTTDEAVFSAYWDWDGENDIYENAFQFSLVFEDGTWKYLEY